jgi:hypothetical protein
MNYVFHTYSAVASFARVCCWRRDGSQDDMAGLTETIEWAKQHQVPVTVFGPVAEYDGPLPRLLAYSITWNKPGLASKSSYRLFPIHGRAHAEHGRKARGISPIFPSIKATCDQDGCLEFADSAHEIPLMRDADHFTELRLGSRGQASGQTQARSTDLPDLTRRIH